MTERYIFKRKREENWTVLPNDLLQDKDLSWEARGLLCYLLSKPKDWTVRKKDLENQSPVGQYAVKTILEELQEARYVRRKKTRNDKGRYEWITWVFDEPYPEELQEDDKGDTTTPDVTTHGSTSDGSIGDIQSTDKQNTTNSEKPETSPFDDFTDEDWTDYLNEGSAYSSTKPPDKTSPPTKKKLADYPPQHRDLLYPFCQYYRFPFPDEKKNWIKQVDVWVSRDYTAADVANAIDYVDEQEGWEVYQPASITKAFGKVSQDDKQDDWWKEYQEE